MGLQVWLPLNGNLHNQGLADTTTVNNGATVDDIGKIGKCYSFDGNDDFISISCSDLYNIFSGGSQPFSIAFWVYHADTTRAIIFGDYGLSGTISFNIELTSDAHRVRFFWNGTPDKIFNANSSVGINTWTHIVLVYDGNEICIYKNGVQQSDKYSGTLAAKSKTSGAFYLGRDNRTGATALNGKLNDFRIYDYALSPREVNEISKGLVLHYPLAMPGGNNIYINSDTVFNSNGNRLSSTTVYNGLIVDNNSPGGKYRSWDIVAENNTNRGIYYTYQTSNGSLNLTENEIYTVSFYARCSKQKNMIVSFIAESQTLLTYDGIAYSSVSNNIIVDTVWKRHSVTFKYISTAKITTCFYLRSLDENVTLDIALPKLELGDHPTPWIPNPSDSLYSSLGLNSSVEYDVSGYQHNGTKAGAITYDADTPRYETSTHISATDQYIKVENLGTSGFGNSYTFSWWSKVSTFSNMQWGFSNGVRLNGMYGGKLWNTGDGSNNPLYIPNTTTQVTVPTTSVWHHWVMTGDGTTCRVYQDGELWGIAKTYKSISGTTLCINGWNDTTQYKNSYMVISDFRIYATALSADDVAELYNTPISLSNNGTLMGYEYVEV